MKRLLNYKFLCCDYLYFIRIKDIVLERFYLEEPQIYNRKEQSP